MPSHAAQSMHTEPIASTSEIQATESASSTDPVPPSGSNEFAMDVEASAQPSNAAEDFATPDAPAASSPAVAPESSSNAVATKKVDANLKVWKPYSGMPPRIPELPESYYNPTAGQLRSAQAGQTNKLKSLGVDTNFTTKKQRDQEAKEREEARIKRHPKTIIRIRFHDKHQVETVFPSSATIKSVYNFAKSTLNEETRNEPFVLYSPPRTEYKPTDPKVEGRSLLDLQLAPSSALLIRFSKNTLNDGNKQAPIKPDLLEIAQELPQPKSFDPTPEQAAAQGSSTDDTDAAGDEKGKGKLLGGQAKVPKWLQKVAKK